MSNWGWRGGFAAIIKWTLSVEVEGVKAVTGLPQHRGSGDVIAHIPVLSWRITLNVKRCEDRVRLVVVSTSVELERTLGSGKLFSRAERG